MRTNLFPRASAVMAAALGLAAASCGVTNAAAGPSDPISARVVTSGTRPFTDSWRAMVGRTQLSLSAYASGFPRLPRLRRPPNPDQPPVAIEGRVAAQRFFETPTVKAAPAIGTAFAGITHQNEKSELGYSFVFPPDTQGAIGPNHFVEMVNGSVTVFNRSGARVGGARVTLDDFFTVGSFPRNGAFDPRLFFDRRSGRWLASCLEFNTVADNDVILAVSRTSDPTGVWDKYVIPVGDPPVGGTSFFSDYVTMGTDDNGVYFGIVIAPSSGPFTVKIVCTPKAPLLAGSPSLGAVTEFSGISDVTGNVQPALRIDAAGPSDPAWFVGSRRFLDGLSVRTVTWSGGVPTLSGIQNVFLTQIGSPLVAPASGSSPSLDATSSRTLCAVVRNNQLWTTRNIGVNITGSANVLPGGTTDADRTGAEWIQLNLSGAVATLGQNGRIFDNAATTPRFFFYPAVTVNGQGHAVVGFNASRGSEFAGAYVCSRVPTDPPGTMGPVTLLKAGEASYVRTDTAGRNRWGDYSYSSVDPLDDQSIWTIQEFAGSGSSDNWATWIAKVLAPAPTLNNPSGSGGAGTSGVTLALTGTGFFDPGAGFARPAVSLSGTGITVTNLVVNSSTSATATLTLASGAAVGTRDVTFTNPDGQSVTVSNGFTVAPATGGTVQFSVATSAVAEGGIATITVTRSGDTSMPATVNFSAAAGTASAADFTPTNGTLTFVIGDTSETFQVTTGADNLLEGDETVSLTLSGAVGTTIGGGAATLTITDNLNTPAPSGVTAVAGSAREVTVNWVDNSGNETGFVIERTGGGATVTLNAGAGATSLLDTTTAGSTAYAYRVKAVNGAIESVFSAAGNVTTPAGPPVEPVNVSAAFVSPSQVNVTWQHPSADETSFRVDRRTAATAFAQVATAAAGATSATDTTGVLPNTTYFYRVVAINASGESPSSETQLNVPGGGKAKITPASLKFAATFTGLTSKPKTITIKNLDKTTSLFVSVGAPTGPFAVTSGGGTTTLPPKGTLKVVMTFNPTVVGLAAGQIVITTGDPLVPSRTVPLSGTGKAPRVP